MMGWPVLRAAIRTGAAASIRSRTRSAGAAGARMNRHRRTRRATRFHRSTEIAVGIERPMGTDYSAHRPVDLLRHVAVPVVGPLAGLQRQAVDVRHDTDAVGGDRPCRRRKRSAGPPPGAAPCGAPAAPAADAAAPGAVPAQQDLRPRRRRRRRDPDGPDEGDHRSRRCGVSRAELLKEKVAPDWTASGLLGLVTGKTHDADRHTVLLEVSPARVYVAQTGVVGGSFPNHRTPFTAVDGPRELAAGQDGSTSTSCRRAAACG